MLGTIENPRFRVGPLVLPAGVLVVLVATVLRLVLLTLRIRTHDQAGIARGAHEGGCILIFWHNRIIGMLAWFRKFYGNRKGAVVLTSASGEGTILSRILATFGIGAVRGSSSRRGTPATLELLKKLRGGYDVVLTPDGPRGPRYKLGPGPVFLAYKTGQPICMFQIEYSRFIRMKTWDGFMIPLPFSRVDITSLPLEFINAEDVTALEPERQRLEQLLQPATV